MSIVLICHLLAPRIVALRALKRSSPDVRRRRKLKTPVWAEILKIAESIPEPDLHKLPTDLAANHDHYLRGEHLL